MFQEKVADEYEYEDEEEKDKSFNPISGKNKSLISNIFVDTKISSSYSIVKLDDILEQASYYSAFNTSFTIADKNVWTYNIDNNSIVNKHITVNDIKYVLEDLQ